MKHSVIFFYFIDNISHQVFLVLGRRDEGLVMMQHRDKHTFYGNLESQIILKVQHEDYSETVRNACSRASVDDVQCICRFP